MEVSHDLVVKYMTSVIEKKVVLSNEQHKQLLDECSKFLAQNNQNYLKKMRKKNRKENLLKDREKLEQCTLRKIQQKQITTYPMALPSTFNKIEENDVSSDFNNCNNDNNNVAKTMLEDAETKNYLKEEENATTTFRICYICKCKYNTIHHFYPNMCDECGDKNYNMRFFSSDMTGKTALVTGARVKIGFEIALKLLRSGARVICVTRFPKDALCRYQGLSDYASWKERLDIRGVDLRYTPGVEDLCQGILRDYARLDIIINNACQTIQKPTAFYTSLIEKEGENCVFLNIKSKEDLHLTETEKVVLFPSGCLDVDGQQVDLRKVNSWNLDLADVSTVELCETILVNYVACFIINARLKPIMVKSGPREEGENRSYIVNVSAMEGQFYRTFKTTKHPHTNGAKAALNMMTRTSAFDYAKSNIYMTSVDTGWVTDEHPIGRREHDFHPPLDCVDGASRVLHPIFEGETTKNPVFGVFLKDYTETLW
jgi:NAD(P)-dependent dehydrogenase (short-subunit alcohol dehydrogenase family)